MNHKTTGRAAALLGLALFLAGCSGRDAAIGPPPRVTPELLERGRYLATAGNCAACHTTADGAIFAGGLAFETPFGKLFSANITPDPDTGIGRWSLAQFAAALRHGVRASGEHLYPVFPYTAFTQISDADVVALYAYLRALQPVRVQLPPNQMHFPFGWRALLAPWKLLFFDAGAFKSDPTQSVEMNRGAYLVKALGHCSACHSPRNLLGAERSGRLMTGGVLRDDSGDGVVRAWSAPNLTNASNGLGRWSVEDIVAYLKTGTNRYAMSYGPMNNVIFNSTRHLADADLRAMALYLKSLQADEGIVGPAPGADVRKAGETLYTVHCGSCHQPDGRGAEESAPPLAGSLVVQSSHPATLINTILNGPDLPEPVPGAHKWRHMEPHGDDLTDEDVAALASYVRTAWGNRGGAVTPADVQAQR